MFQTNLQVISCDILVGWLWYAGNEENFKMRNFSCAMANSLVSSDVVNMNFCHPGQYLDCRQQEIKQDLLKMLKNIFSAMNLCWWAGPGCLKAGFFF